MFLFCVSALVRVCVCLKIIIYCIPERYIRNFSKYAELIQGQMDSEKTMRKPFVPCEDTS